LSPEQVNERLQSVLVFALTDQEGAPLTESSSQEQNRPAVVRVFISRQDAQTYLNTLQQERPEAVQGVQVTPVSLSQVYQLARQSQEQQNAPAVAFTPIQQQREEVRSLLGENANQFQGVPLFMVRSTQGDGSDLVIRYQGQEVIPIYFTREQAQAALDRLREVQPEVASSMGLQVISLEGLLQNLESSDNEELTRLYLVPSTETLEFIQTLQPNGGQQQPGQGQQQPAQGQPQNQNQQRPNQQAPQNQQQPAQPRQ
jgi:nickel transport protein